MKLWAIDTSTGERVDISQNLYWFEENLVRDFGNEYYRFELELPGGQIIELSAQESEK